MIKFVNDSAPYLSAENLNANFDECNNIIESGSNSNGSYIKFSDGTMICHKSYSGTATISATLGNVYYNGYYGQAGDLPQTFTSVLRTFVNVINDYEIWSSTNYAATTTKWPSRVDLFAASTKSNVAIQVDMLVIGTWK